MTTLAISSQGQITLPLEILQIDTWKGHDDISDLGGFFKNNSIVLTDEELYKPVDLTEESV